MNYRHHFHAGNFADVVKHVLLTQLMGGMQRKEKGFFYLDTHAGAGGYELAAAVRGDSLERKPEYPDGIGRLWNTVQLPQPLADYVALVRDFNRRSGALNNNLVYYPGSPWIAKQLARPQDRLAFVEFHPGDGAILKRQFAKQAAAKVHIMDGYRALKAMLPPLERRALVLIDPPFEQPDEFALVTQNLAEALERFPTGVYALWYPLTMRAKVDNFYQSLIGLALPPTLIAEVTIAGEKSLFKMKGCGLAVLNPPWQFDPEIRRFLPVLAKLLEQESGAEARVDWLVPEAL